MFLIMSKPSLFRVFVLLGGAAVVNSKTGYTCRETFDENLATIRDKTNSDIHFSIPSDAVLYSGTNRRHSVPIEITNNEQAPVTLLLLHDEVFPTRDLLADDIRQHKHVELLKNISTDKVRIDTNDTEQVDVNFFIPDYVPQIMSGQFYRSKVTVSARKSFENIKTEIIDRRWRKEVSFYLTVSDVDLSLEDALQPACSATVCSDWDECNVENCQLAEWHARLVINDNITGVRSIEVLDDPDLVTASYVFSENTYRLAVGTTKDVQYWVRASCCLPGVDIAVTDMAGNVEHCVVGKNTNNGNRRTPELLPWLIIWTISQAWNCL